MRSGAANALLRFGHTLVTRPRPLTGAAADSRSLESAGGRATTAAGRFAQGAPARNRCRRRGRMEHPARCRTRSVASFPTEWCCTRSVGHEDGAARAADSRVSGMRSRRVDEPDRIRAHFRCFISGNLAHDLRSAVPESDENPANLRLQQRLGWGTHFFPWRSMPLLVS
jgi:hypothetical protein